MVVWLKEWDRCPKEGEYIYVPPQKSRKQLSWMHQREARRTRFPSAPAQWWSTHCEFTTQFPHGGHHKALFKCCWFFYCNFPMKKWSRDMDRQYWIFFIFLRKKILFSSRCINNVQSCNTMKHAHPHPLDRWWCVRPATGCNIGLKAVEIYLLTLSIVHHPRSHARAFLPRCHTDELTSDPCEI